MIRKLLITSFLICQLWNNGFSQNFIDKKLIGVWKLKEPNSDVCLVIIDQKSGAMTDESGLVYYYYTYQITSDKAEILFNKHIPIYHDEKENDKYLIQFKDDTTLLLNKNIKEKNAQMMQGKNILTYSKLLGLDAENFIRKRSQKDLIGTWLSISKKDTTLALNFKSNNVLEVKNPKKGQHVSGRYMIDCDKQPMTLNIINDKGDIQQNIFVFVALDRIRLAGPKRGQRRSHFTVFGDNIFLKKELPN